MSLKLLFPTLILSKFDPENFPFDPYGTYNEFMRSGRLEHIADEKARLYSLYQEKLQTEQQSLDKFVDPVIPQVPPQPVEGEPPQLKV